MYITKKGLIFINIFLIILEIILVYFIINSVLTKDLISPSNNISLKYIKSKTSRIVNYK